MISFPAVLSFHGLKNCFGYLHNDDILPFLDFTIQVRSYRGLGIFTVKSVSKNITVATQIFISNSACAKFCNGSQVLLFGCTFAEKCGFCEGDQVFLEELDNVPSCLSISIRPETFKDWNLIKSFSPYIESNLLNQLKVVLEKVTYPLFFEDPVDVCYFTVEKVVSNFSKRIGTLKQDTELYVLPIDGSFLTDEPAKENNDANSVDAIVQHLSRCVSSTLMTLHSSFIERCVSSRSFCFDNIALRVIPRHLCEGFVIDLHPTAIFTADVDRKAANPFSIVRVKAKGGESSIFAVHLRLSLEDMRFKKIRRVLQNHCGHCLISRLLQRHGFADYTWLTCTSVPTKNIRKLKHLRCVVSDNPPGLHEAIINYFYVRCTYFPIVLSAVGFSVEITLPGGGLRLCHFLPETSLGDVGTECYIFTCNSFPAMQFVMDGSDLENRTLPTKPTGKDGLVTRGEAMNLGESNEKFLDVFSQSSCVENCVRLVEYCLSMSGGNVPGHLLIIGRKMCGKSVLTKRLARRLLFSAAAVYSTSINCVLWRGRSADYVEKQLSKIAVHISQRRPSFLVLENLDFTSFSEEEHRDMKVDKIFSIVKKVVEQYHVFVVATARSSCTQLGVFKSFDGKRFFFRTVEIVDLEPEERLEALKFFIEKSGLQCCCLQEAVAAAENYVIGDLKRISQRIVFEAISKKRQKVELEDIRGAFDNFIPIGQHAKPRENDFQLTWDDVGGMAKVKKVLCEVVIWPSKYPELFHNCPVRLGRGVLLHGPTGCGKTLIAKAVASESGFTIIHIKGPELLSKYIGQSEENVRQIFERARSSRPCLVLFDEFDSLGPKRGHDSTGVTDRVVNQLLTELDGFEALEGVYIIATTNRLDLIDPALIRPGRFDHIVECPLPDCEERNSILAVLCSKTELQRDVDISYIATKTEGWSGADLKGLVTSAQFLETRSLFPDNDGSMLDIEAVTCVTLSMADFIRALGEGRPLKQQSKKDRLLETDLSVTLA